MDSAACRSWTSRAVLERWGGASSCCSQDDLSGVALVSGLMGDGTANRVALTDEEMENLRVAAHVSTEPPNKQLVYLASKAIHPTARCPEDVREAAREVLRRAGKT